MLSRGHQRYAEPRPANLETQGKVGPLGSHHGLNEFLTRPTFFLSWVIVQEKRSARKRPVDVHVTLRRYAPVTVHQVKAGFSEMSLDSARLIMFLCGSMLL